MSFSSVVPAITLHGTLLVCGAFTAWLCLRRQSPARMLSGGRMIMAATLFLAAGEAGLAVRSSFESADNATRSDRGEPALPDQPGPASDLLLAGGPDSPAGSSHAPVSSAAKPRFIALRWEFSPAAATMVTTVWLSGAGLILARWLFALWARWRMARAASRVEDPEWLNMLRQIAGGRRVKLLRHPDNIVPCAWSGVILLPAGAHGWPVARRRMVLAHECAHLRQRDPLWLAVSRWFLALQWFNPVAWRIVRQCRLASERAADDAVLATVKDGFAYADLLVGSARALPGRQTVLCSMANPSTIGQRVARILDESADRRPAGILRRVLSVVLSAVLAATVMLLSPELAFAQEKPAGPALSAEEGPAPITDPAAELRHKLQSAVLKEVKWMNTPLTDALRDLGEQTNIHFILRVGEGKTLTLNLRDVPLREVVGVICELTGMQSDIQPRAIVIQPAGASPSMETMTFRVPDKVAAGLTGNQSAKDLLERAGIKFPEGSNAAFEPQSRRLIVKTVRSEFPRIENYLEAGNADAPFEWSPLTLDGREYVSAQKVRRFYQFTDALPDAGGEHTGLTFRSPPLLMHWSNDSQEIQINDIKFVLNVPVRAREGTLWISRTDLTWTLEPVLRPHRIVRPQTLTTVIIDPGHGGEETGAVSLHGKESFYNLDTALMLKEKLEAAGWKVIMTRTSDDFVPRPARVDIANQHPDAVFISIHFGSYTSSRQGIETYILKPSAANPVETPEDGPEALRSRSVALATAVHVNCLRNSEMKDRGIQGARFDVLAGVRIPGILVEGGYLSNMEDAARIADANHRDKFAAALAQGLESYRLAAGQDPKQSAPAQKPPR